VHFDILFYPDESAQPVFKVVLVDFERLHDDDATLHHALDHLNFCFPAALERLLPAEHRILQCAPSAIAAPASSNP